MTDKQIGQGTAAGLIEYLDILVEKGRATNGAIQPLKTAFLKVIKKVDGDNWRSVKVNAIDVTDYINRFSVLTRGTYTPRSIDIYRARVQRVAGWYLRFMSTEEAGYMPQIDTRAPRGASKTLAEAVVVSSPEVPAVMTADIDTMPIKTSAAGLIEYPFPLANSTVAVLKLPLSLTAAEASRLSTFISSLVIE